MLRSKTFFVFFILIFMQNVFSIKCFDVNFRAVFDVKIEEDEEMKEGTINKRDMTQFFDKASFSFNGFNKTESVPVMFPLDICLLSIEGVRYATSLHTNKNDETSFAVFRLNMDNYELIVDIAMPNAIAMDCKSLGAFGYVAIALNITEPVENARQGSPIYEIADDRVRAVQYFATPNMRSVHLRVTGSDLFLLQSFDNTKAMPSLNCPYFKWSGSTFNRLGHIPCSNARNLQPFSIDYEQYVAVANYADQNGRTNVNSEIYKFNRGTQKFHLLQKIKTNGAVDVQYFKVPQNAARNQHFLIFGNSLSKTVHGKPGEQLEADSVFYQYDKGVFVPYQSISLYAVEKFLPIENEDAEKFLLLVACANQDIKIFNLNDWKFEVSNVQYTEGALGKGVAKMRVYKEQGTSYLVIANELMADNETNIFQPIFKQEEHANMLREEIINWSKANFARLAAIDMEKLQQKVHEKLAKHKMKSLDLKEIPSANISNVITKSLTYAPRHFNSDYWLALRYAKKALDVLETLYPAERLQKRQLKEKSKESLPDNLEYEFKEMHLKTLIVRDKLKAKMVNGVSNTEPILQSIKAKQIKTASRSRQASAEKLDQLNVEHLQLKGRLNGLTWSDLLNNTLKREAGVQFIKSPAEIKRLKTSSVSIASNTVSGRNLGQLVRIDGGNYVVNQEVQFAERIKAKNVIINDRLNNIHVHKQKFDVLLKRANETQIIDGFKIMENLRVLEPITLAGQMLGAHLQEMQPNKAIHEPLVLQGDYSIAGDVTIKKMLKAKDLIQIQQGKRSIGELLHNGIQMTAGPLQDLRLSFAMPIVANNTLVSFINGEDMQQLVHTNENEVQVIEAQKTFKQSLVVEHGLSQVKQLNGIDTESLEEQFLTKHTNQRMPMAMHFGRVLAKSYNSSTFQLNGKPLDAYLRHSGDQQISAPLKIEQLQVNTLDAGSLNTNGQIFGVPLEDIYQQRAKIAPIESIFKQYFNGSIYVRNLLVKSSINGKPVSILEQQLNQIDGNIKYVGNYHFNYPMTIANLTFEGALNGIKAEKFGKCWLQKHGKQSFTAPQSLASVQAKNGVMLMGKINSHDLEDFYEQTFWVSRDESFGDVQFVNPIEMQGVLKTQQLNELSIPDDILFRQAAEPQKLHGPLTIQGQAKIHGHVKNITQINSHNLNMLHSFLTGEASIDKTLHVQHAKFATAPMYRTLNRHNLRRCLDEAWLTNENVILHNDVEIADAYFTGLLDFEGPINNMNLNYLQENYVSLTQPQDIQTELSFMDTVQFNDELSAEHVFLNGPMQDLQSNAQFDFAKFVANTLKRSDPQTITGTWHLNQVQVHGDLQNVLVNGLNMANDIVHVGMPVAVITAPKKLQRAQIQKLHATPLSTINKVPIAKWIKDTVYLYDNVTVYGTTTMEAINLFNDLSVRGSVNGQRFAPDNLLLRSQPQLIHGNIHIHNAQPIEQRFLTNNIENLNVDYVNGRAMGEFFDNVAVLNSTIDVGGHLVFEQALNVRSLEAKQTELDLKQVKRSAAEQLENAFDDLQHEVDDLRNSIKVSAYRLDHFRLLQTIPQSSSELFVYSQAVDGVMMDFIGFLNAEKNQTVHTYYYQKDSEQFVYYKDIDLQDLNDPWKARKYQVFAEYSKAASEHVILAIGGQQCVASYGNEHKHFVIYCLDDGKYSLNFNPYAKLPKTDIKEVLNFNEQYTALLFSNGLEVWDMLGIKMKQRIKIEAAIKATHVSLASNTTYLAIISANDTYQQDQAQLSIYRSFHGSALMHMQSLVIPMPLDIVMSANAFNVEDDLLLYLITAGSPQKLLIYQYKGVMGLELLVETDKIIPGNFTKLEVLSLQYAEKSLLALSGSANTVLVEIVYKML